MISFTVFVLCALVWYCAVFRQTISITGDINDICWSAIHLVLAYLLSFHNSFQLLLSQYMTQKNEFVWLYDDRATS